MVADGTSEVAGDGRPDILGIKLGIELDISLGTDDGCHETLGVMVGCNEIQSEVGLEVIEARATVGMSLVDTCSGVGMSLVGT